jgi:hypothetical protein
MIHFFKRAGETMACETRLSPEGEGYELVVTTGDKTQVEPFTELADMLAHEHELLLAWRAQGWRDETATVYRPAAPNLATRERRTGPPATSVFGNWQTR